MTAELDVLQDVVTRLEQSGIAYMLTGSLALSCYAQPRMTRDIDVVVELSGPDAASVTGLFQPDFYVSEADVRRAIDEQGMFNVLHLEKVVKLNFIVRKDTSYRRHEFERRKRVQMPGFEAWIVSREDLILSKLLWAKESASELQLRACTRYSPVERTRRILTAGRASCRSRICSRGPGMQDTNPDFRALVAERFAQMPADERVRICTEMFDTARALVEASLPKDLGLGELRYRICERFYGDLAARAYPRR